MSHVSTTGGDGGANTKLSADSGRPAAKSSTGMCISILKVELSVDEFY